ncbi:MAG TPA: N-acetyl-gamma-glutamyl-phosphate reductase [Candidatus Aminicenantes bacterium]|mgnify:CR=1 FL=1|nr:N-acetyl-gamma-glutamyl-phosphate reductase [Candidatus Aminicenantes bacterium]
MAELRVGIVGASGYGGGELLRLCLAHPQLEVTQVTSERFRGRGVGTVHPNLRRRCALEFRAAADLRPCDLLFLCLPHGESSPRIDEFRALAPRIVDLSADFRLRSAADYVSWYGWHHPRPELLGSFVYGIPELHREAMRTAPWISSAGCNATAVILALWPLARAGMLGAPGLVIDLKVGSSEGGRSAGAASHHPERSHCLRTYKASGHRHGAEMIQELGLAEDYPLRVTVTAVELVRGILATCHVPVPPGLTERDIWRLYRAAYGDEPFLRLVREREGNYRFPEPKILWGSNGCDIGFELDARGGRLVVISALDNLMKGAAGQALQAANLQHGFSETTGLDFFGLHPV